MAVQVQSFNQGDWLKWEEADHRLSRDEVILASGQANIRNGTVLGAVAPSGTAIVVVPAGANVGKGVLTMDASTPVLAAGKPGAYIVKCTTASAGGGTFTVYDPQGNSVGTVVVGATFATQIKFVVAAGTPDFALNDFFTIEVGPVSPATVTALNLSGADGTQNAAGVLLYTTDATSAAVKTTMIAHHAILSAFGLTWPTGITQVQMAAAVAQLAAKGIMVRASA